MLKLYTKVEIVFIKLYNVIKALKLFIYVVRNNIFGSDSKAVLKLINKFIELEVHNFKQTITMGRTVEDSVKLLTTLIGNYIEDASDKALYQLFEVLKAEFITRK